MHLVFERSKGRFKSNCNILALAWTPYYNETKFRLALFDYHQKQLINLTSSNANQPEAPRGASGNGSNVSNAASPANNNIPAHNNNQPQPAGRAPVNQAPPAGAYLNSRVAELYQRHVYLTRSNQLDAINQTINQDQDQVHAELGDENKDGAINNNGTDYHHHHHHHPAGVGQELGARYGRMPNFGWLVVGNVGKIVGVTLTSTLPPPPPLPDTHRANKRAPAAASDGGPEGDLMQFHEEQDSAAAGGDKQSESSNATSNSKQPMPVPVDAFRPDNGTFRDNYNLRGHLDEVILVKWNELYQKLATIDSKGNVLIWCKINEKFTIQTPFYNRTKTVADFKWSNDGKTALICYTDSFILVGSSSGQRHWHSMLNLDDYHITCASWTPNDEQLLLGVSNGNVVVIDLPRSELTELVVNQTNIRTMCWSSSYLSLSNLNSNNNPLTMSPDVCGSGSSSASSYSSSSSAAAATRGYSNSSYRRHSTVVNHRRLSRDCSVFSRYRFCSQAPSNISASRARNSSSLGRMDNEDNGPPDSGTNGTPNAERIFNFLPQLSPPSAGGGGHMIVTGDGMPKQQACDNDKNQLRNILAIDFANNTIKLYDGGLEDPEPRTIQVNQESYIMHWSGDGKHLAVAGFNIHTTAPSVGCLRCRYLNSIKFYNQRGHLVYEHTMRYTRYPITAFTWAHDDRRLFVATGPRLHCAKVFLGIPPLSLLAVSCFQQYTKIPDKADILDMIFENKLISSSVVGWRSHNCPIINLDPVGAGSGPESINDQADTKDYLIEMQPSTQAKQQQQVMNVCNNSNVYQYQLPVKLQIKIDQLFTQTIRQPFDEHWSLNDIIWHVPKNEQRYYCTLVCYTSDRDINSSGHQYRTNLLEKSSHHHHPDNHTSDQNKIFVLYVEFQGSLIPILRARRVGFLKPEFVIFDPEDGRQDATGARLHGKQQRKVSDISQQSSTSDFLNGFLRRRLAAAAEVDRFKTSNQSPVDYQFNYSNEGFADNCSELHLYSEPRASSSSLTEARQSIDDAEHYYNFDADASPPAGSGSGRHHHHHQGYNNHQPQHYTNQAQSSSSPSNNNNRLADLVSDRSHHQEPVALPIMGNPYLLYMMSLSASHGQQAGGARANRGPQGRETQLGGGKRKSDRYKLRGSSGAGGSLTENNELIRIRSNIWGTKFKLINVGNRMIKQRSVLGSVAYKASILHLQPRQIFLTIKDMSNYCCLCSMHHHTRQATPHHRRHHQQQQQQQQRKRPTINNNHSTSALAVNQISLLDMPNLEKPFIVGQPLKGRTPTKKSHQDQRHNQGSAGDTKVVLAVGDSIRVAPKLDPNQRYRFANTTHNKQVDNQSSKALRGEGRLYFEGLRRNSGNSVNNKHRSRQPPAQEVAGGSDRNSRTKSYRYPSSATHSINNNNDDILKGGVGSMFKKETSCSTRDMSDQQDDILTLSLGQGDQVRVEMSSLSNIKTLADTRPSAMTSKWAGEQPISGGPAAGPSGSQQESGKALDEFLATNKTLKSIQTITKMIVDLSSKADNDSEVVTAGLDQPSPSKLVRLSSDVSPFGLQSRASSFIPPDTPVHRPRRVASRMMAAASGTLLPSGIETSCSATSTPLKGIHLDSNSKSSSRRHHRRSRHRSHHMADKDSQISSDVPLPPPPPSIPIGRRLSSSAKRFIDGSLRSLYGGGYSASASDIEPEETELLVSGRSPCKAKIAKELLRHSRTAGHSQPCTPSKRPVTSSGKQPSDLSLRVQLMQRLRGEKSIMSPAPAPKSGDGGGLGRPRKSSWQYDRKGPGTAGSLNSSGLELSNGGEGSSPDHNHHYHSSSSHSSPSSSLSASSPSSSDDDDNSDSEMDNAGHKSRKGAHKFSTSVKDLRELGRLNRLKTAGKNCEPQPSQRGKAANRNRYRRKSMCPDSGCCCAREFELKNRPPVWNESSQVYQLDFGGRVTQESAKNLQIDFDGKLALQFGRIDRCTYTLDYKYPFNAVQAMAIALASLTQRLK